ncbi:MAG: hypothetical protein ABJC98_09905 [Bacteroidota bacterium]
MLYNDKGNPSFSYSYLLFQEISAARDNLPAWMHVVKGNNQLFA